MIAQGVRSLRVRMTEQARRRCSTDHPRHALLRGAGYWRRLGPGIVTGAADDDPSRIGTYSQVGAAFGYGLLWTTLATLPLAMAVQEASARLGLVTGKGLAALIRQRLQASSGPGCSRCPCWPAPPGTRSPRPPAGVRG
jgi:hypothetical protein